MTDKKTWKTPELTPLSGERTDGKDHRVSRENEVTMTTTVSTIGGMLAYPILGETIGPS